MVSGGIDKTRLSLKYGTTVIRDDSQTAKTLNYCHVWNGAALVFDGGVYDGYGEIAVEGGSFSATNCTFHKVQNATRNGNINLLAGSFETKNCVIDSVSQCVLLIGGAYSAQSSYNATYVMDGGSLKMGGGVTVGRYGTGTFILKDGLVQSHEISQDWPQKIGDAASAFGTVNITGGEWQLLGGPWGANEGKCSIYVGNNGNGTVNVSGTGVFSLVPGDSSSKNCRGTVWIAKNAGSTGTLNLNEGGTFLTWGKGLVGGDGNGALVFNGGTFAKASDSTTATSTYVETNLTTVAVGPKGGVVDTGTKNLKFCDPIVDLDASVAPDGFFEKRGSGTLTFHGANTYHAPTRVSEGVIALADAGALSPNSQLWVDSGITVNLSGAAAQTVGGLAGKGTISNVSLTTAGAICPGGTNEVGTLTLSNCPLTLAQGARLVIDVDAQGSCDTLVVSGTASPLDLSNLTIEVRGSGAHADSIGPIVQCAAGATGTPTVTGTSCKSLSVAASGDVRLSKPGTTIIMR